VEKLPSITNGKTLHKIDHTTSGGVHENDRSVVEAYILDDSYWRNIKIEAESSTVCSYRLLNANRQVEYNTFELQISDMENVQIGLYYGNKDSEVVDLKLFTPAEC
jgi:hypothetical protein